MSDPDCLTRARAAHIAHVADRQARAEELPGGWLLIPAAPPGVGWILEPPSVNKHGQTVTGGGTPRRYYATKDGCLARYRQLKETKATA